MPTLEPSRTREPRPSRAAATPRSAGISDAAVLKATGQDWTHWLKVLDRFDVKAHGHARAAQHLAEKHAVGPWWSQMIVVGYEQARGLRVKHQKTDGFSVSASRALPCSVAKAYAAWGKPRLASWFPDPGFTIRTATKNRSIRALWIDGVTTVEIMFYAKGPAKCQVTAQHNKLASASAAKKMKAYWATALDALREALTTSS